MADKNEFKREIRALIVTLVLFSLTYMLRGIWDLKIFSFSDAFGRLMIEITIVILCDVVPVMFLLGFHFRNLNKKEEKDVTEEEVQQVRGESAEGYLNLHFVPESESSFSAE